jgi:cytoskeleton protein RodZ
MGQDDQQPLNAETDDWVFSSGISPGPLLKKEREKKGLSHAQISQQTRLRPHFIEAIENEEWDLLPAPTLVKGYIRSYARVLALDEERLVALYSEEAVSDNFPKEFALPSIPKRKIWPFVVGALLVVLVAVSGFLVWMIYPTDSEEIFDSVGTGVQSPPESPKTILPDEEQKAQEEPSSEKNTPSKVDSELMGGVSAVSFETPEKPLPSPDLPIVLSENEFEEKNSSAVGEIETATLLLKGHVTERTWMRISIDGLKSKEYTFGPSDTPEWKAEKGFELLIGNAGGIALEFNGKRMDNLGKQGQVVRIKLPEDEERSSARN